MRTLRTALAACATVAVTASVAFAAAPVAQTQPATNVSATTATLNGIVTPNGEDTTYVFEYGTAGNFDTKTAAVVLKGNGPAQREVTFDVVNLAPSTAYSYRLVATNASGTSTGATQTFTTTASGAATTNALTIDASRKTVTFGGVATTISGILTGPDSANREVTLEQNPFPYTGGFKSTGLTVRTSATGAYSIAVSPAVNTRYRVVTTEKKPTTSPEVTVRVRVKVTARVSDSTPSIGQRVRFAGTVLPGHDGKVAKIQRRTSSGGWRTVAQTTLVAASPVGTTSRSKYAKRVRVNSTGVYRVRVAPGDGDHIAGNSRRRTLTVG
jgi:hypothetical protein